MALKAEVTLFREDSISISGTFEYFKENPNHWSGVLNEMSRAGNDDRLGHGLQVEIPVHWSVHESIKGMRDFSRSSRLRIEKALTCAEEAGLKVKITTGFPTFLESTPLWARSNWEVSSLIPSGRVFERALGNELTTLSSIHDFEFRSGWLAFLEELFSILSLYIHPEGPIASVEIDLDIFRLDQGAIRAPGFGEALAKRYRTIEQLNLKYRSSFRSFDTVCSSQGFRVLLDKRPWHAIDDYKWCREKLLDDLAKEILALPSAERVRDAVSLKRSARLLPAEKAESSDDCIFNVDACFLETWVTSGSLSVFPAAPEGFLHPQTALALRVWRAIADASEISPIQALPFCHEEDGSFRILESSHQVFICGRFLPVNAVTEIQRYVSQGGEAIFPFGMPQFDESLNPIVWKTGVGVSVALDSHEATLRKMGNGRFWVPSKMPEFDDNFCTGLLEFAQAVRRLKA